MEQHESPSLVEPSSVTPEQLKQIGEYTRRPFSPEELYLFSVTLCDNEVDRDGERFTDEALEQLGELLVGKTGIFDHDPKGGNQTARLFDCHVVELPGQRNSLGQPYKRLQGQAYMVRSQRNADLILEIDGGIKKEVSISCLAKEAVCSICGADRRQAPCEHKTGQLYGDKRCHTLLGGITDAYEWSFVAVPAQPAAGVTKSRSLGWEESSLAKRLGGGEVVLTAAESYLLRERLGQLEELAEGGRTYRKSLQQEAARLLCIACPSLTPDSVERMTGPLSLSELEQCSKALLPLGERGKNLPQLVEPIPPEEMDETGRSFQLWSDRR